MVQSNMSEFSDRSETSTQQSLVAFKFAEDYLELTFLHWVCIESK